MFPILEGGKAKWKRPSGPPHSESKSNCVGSYSTRSMDLDNLIGAADLMLYSSDLCLALSKKGDAQHFGLQLLEVTAHAEWLLLLSSRKHLVFSYDLTYVLSCLIMFS
jgi:hypothetical protein